MKYNLNFLACFFLLLNSSIGQALKAPPQDIGLPYTRSANAKAIAVLKNHIACYAGSRYAWVYGKKMRLDDQHWQDEAIAKDGDLYIPESFAALLTVQRIITDTAPSYLKDKWVHEAERPVVSISRIRKHIADGRTYVSLKDMAALHGYRVSHKYGRLFIIGRHQFNMNGLNQKLSENIVSQFDTPEKFADPDIATKYIPMLTRQGKWTDHVKVTDNQLAILNGPETKWSLTPEHKYDFSGFNSGLLGSAVPAPGIFPRILFSEQDIHMLKNRIIKSRIGQMSLMEIEYLLKKTWWDETTSDGMIFKKLYNGVLDSLAWPDDGPIPNAPPSNVPHQFKGQKPGIFNSHVSYVPECLSLMALYCLLTNDDIHGKQAAAAIAHYFKLREPLIDEWNAASDSEMSTGFTRADGKIVEVAGNGSATSWRNIHGVAAHMNLGFCLDFAGKWMDEAQKKIMYRVIAKATYGRRAYGQDGPMRFRDVNWVTWDLPNFIALTAIEGQEGFDREAYVRNVETVKAFCEWGIDSSGVIYESNGKTAGGMQFHTLSMISLARRGVNLWGHPHIRKLLDAQVQMTSPGGTVIVNSGTQYVPFSQQAFSLQTVNEYKSFFPGNKSADYLLAQAKTFFEKDASFRESMREWIIDGFDSSDFRKKLPAINRLRMPSPMYPGFVHGLLYDTDFDTSVSRVDLNLPLDFDAPVHGVYSAYSDAGRDAVWLNMMVRPNHYIGAGHHHADAGMFHFSAKGVDWFTESPFMQSYDGKYHNQVLIDGQSQAEPFGGKGIAYQAPAIYLGTRLGKSGSFASADLTNSYCYRWLTQPGPIWDESVKSLNWEMDPSEDNLKMFAGTSRYKMRPWWPTYTYSNYMATSRALFNPVQYVYRTVGLIRGVHPYGIVVDDLKKDESAHLYQWVAMLNGGVWKVNIPGLPHTQMVLGKAGSTSLNAKQISSLSPVPGDPMLLVCFLNEEKNTQDSLPLMQVSTESGPIQPKSGLNMPYDRMTINQKSVNARFRILMIPFTYGDVLPQVKYEGDTAKLRWKDGQEDVIRFIVNKNQTIVSVFRGNELLANSE